MKIIRNNIIPVKGFSAINICGVLFMRQDAEVDSILLNHERIHTEQMKELFYVGFYILYLIEWFAGVLGGKRSVESYRNISFEKEAYSNEKDLNYLDHRKKYSQWK